jgi:hypothetical protein
MTLSDHIKLQECSHYLTITDITSPISKHREKSCLGLQFFPDTCGLRKKKTKAKLNLVLSQLKIKAHIVEAVNLVHAKYFFNLICVITSDPCA